MKKQPQITSIGMPKNLLFDIFQNIAAEFAEVFEVLEGGMKCKSKTIRLGWLNRILFKITDPMMGAGLPSMMRELKLKNRYFDGLGGMMRFNHLLNFIHSSWRKVFFSAILAYICGYVLYYNKLSVEPLGICNLFSGCLAVASGTFIHKLFPPYFTIYPFCLVWLIHSYNAYNWHKGYLNMQGLAFSGFTVYKNAWAVFIRRVIFNYFSFKDCMFDFFTGYTPVDSLFSSVLGVTKSFFNKCFLNFYDIHLLEYNTGIKTCQVRLGWL